MARKDKNLIEVKRTLESLFLVGFGEMNIYIKLGTGQGKLMHLCNKRQLPKIGDHVFVKQENKPHIKKEGALIDGISHTANGTLFLAERL